MSGAETPSELRATLAALRNGVIVPCTRPWCDQTEHWAHDEFYPHFKAVADFVRGERVVVVNLTETEPFNGPYVGARLFANVADGAECLVDLTPDAAYALSRILAAMDPAEISQFAKEIGEAAVVLDPKIGEEANDRG